MIFYLTAKGSKGMFSKVMLTVLAVTVGTLGSVAPSHASGVTPVSHASAQTGRGGSAVDKVAYVQVYGSNGSDSDLIGYGLSSGKKWLKGGWIGHPASNADFHFNEIAETRPGTYNIQFYASPMSKSGFVNIPKIGCRVYDLEGNILEDVVHNDSNNVECTYVQQ